MTSARLSDIDCECTERFAWWARLVWRGKSWAKLGRLRARQKARAARHRVEALRRLEAARCERRAQEAFAATELARELAEADWAGDGSPF